MKYRDWLGQELQANETYIERFFPEGEEGQRLHEAHAIQKRTECYQSPPRERSLSPLRLGACMLPSRERLTRGSLFQRAYTARKSISSPLFTLYVVPRFKQPGARGERAASKHSENASEMAVKQKSADRMPLVGFVVAKKVCKSACVRNRAKRRLREAYRLLRNSEQPCEELALSQWYALVWVVHDKALAASWEEIQQTVSSSLAKAHTRFGNSNKSAADSRPSSSRSDSQKNPQVGPGPRP